MEAEREMGIANMGGGGRLTGRGESAGLGFGADFAAALAVEVEAAAEVEAKAGASPWRASDGGDREVWEEREWRGEGGRSKSRMRRGKHCPAFLPYLPSGV